MLYSVYSAYSFLGIECINILQINIDKTRKNTLKRYMKKVLFIFKVRSMWVRKRDYWKPCSVNQLSHSVVSNSLQPHELQHARLPCPSRSPRVCSNSWSLSQQRHPTISSSVVPFYSHLQSFPEPRCFPVSRLFPSGCQSIGVSASGSVLPTNIQSWFPLRWIGWISLQSKGLLRVFSNTTVQKHQFFDPQPSLWSTFYIHTRLLGKP